MSRLCSRRPAMTLNRVRAADATCRCACGCAVRVPRYPTDLTDEQRAVLEPLLPVMPCLTPLGGRRKSITAAR